MKADTRRIWAWALYDWANSAFATTVMAGFFPIFFKQYYSAGGDATVSTAKLGIANFLGSLLLALLSPLLGVISDHGGFKKRFLIFFCFIGVLSTSALYWISQGQWGWAVFWFVLGNVGFGGSIGFYDALLPSVATRATIDRVSALGYSLGYLGGGALFAVNILMYQKPELFGIADGATAIKLGFMSVAIWWAVFTIPLLVFVKEPRGLSSVKGKWLSQGLGELRKTARSFRHYRMALLFLVAFFLYNDGVGTIVRMAVDYGVSIGLDTSDLILALLITQFVGFPSAVAMGLLSRNFHPKKMIFFAIFVYLAAIAWAFFMRQSHEFYVLAVLIGLVQGGIQSLSRSYFSRLIPLERAGEFYGFYNLLGKFTGFIGPLLVGGLGYASGNSRIGILAIALLFVTGAVVLYFVQEPPLE